MSLELIPPGKRKHGKRGANRHYVIRGTVDGERVEIDTQTTDAEAARKAKRRLERELFGDADRLERGTTTFAEAAETYIAWRSPRLQDERAIIRLKRDELGRMKLADITSAVLVQAADRVYAGCTNETKNRHVFTPAAAILHYAAANKLCPYIRIRKLGEKRPEPRAAAPEIAAALVRHARGPMKLLLIWLFTMGTRITETLSVERDKINRDERAVTMKMAKPERWETVPLSEEVWRLLPPKLGGGPLFPWRNRDQVYRRLRPLCDRLGVKFTPHMGRHSFATAIVNEGESLDHLPHWQDPKSRARYGRPSIERQRQVMAGAAGALRGRRQKKERNQ